MAAAETLRLSSSLGLLATLGLLNKYAKLLFLGLDDAGKTNLPHLLKSDRVAILQPTLHPTSEELATGNCPFTAFDLGGHQQARRLWKNYFPEVSITLFSVEVKEHERFAERRAELDSLLTMEELSKFPLCVLRKRIDHPDAVSEKVLRHQLRLWHTTGKGEVPLDGVQPIEVLICSAIIRHGTWTGITDYYENVINWVKSIRKHSVGYRTAYGQYTFGRRTNKMIGRTTKRCMTSPRYIEDPIREQGVMVNLIQHVPSQKRGAISATISAKRYANVA